MDTTLLSKSRQPLDSDYRIKKALDLLKRGYTKNEVREIFRRAFLWIDKELEPNPGSGKIEPMRRDFSRAISEVLADSPDIAVGRFA